MRKGGIAFFDSGIGGLTVLAECRRLMPKGIFYYYGDNGRAPYGNLPPEKIKRYVFAAFEKFKKWKVKAVVIACNTATAVCVEELRKKYAFPIVGIEPAVRPAAARGGEVFVLSTRATYESRRFITLCQRTQREFPRARICAFACDGLAGEIERNLGRREVDFTVFLPRGSPRTVVLGCTHYSYISEQIRRFYGCEVVDGNKGLALRLEEIVRGEEKTRPRVTTRSIFRRKKSEKMAMTGFLNVEVDGNKAMLTGKDGSEIFFLGKDKVVNKTIFEQMFGLKVVE